MRDLTPRMLDINVTVYEEQEESSLKILHDTLNARFEFLEIEVTEASLDKMIKTWISKDRERVKPVFAGSIKAPSKYTRKEWDAIKEYWNNPQTKEKSEQMSKTRKKVVFNPWVGRCG